MTFPEQTKSLVTLQRALKTIKFPDNSDPSPEESLEILELSTNMKHTETSCKISEKVHDLLKLDLFESVNTRQFATEHSYSLMGIVIGISQTF